MDIGSGERRGETPQFQEYTREPGGDIRAPELPSEEKERAALAEAQAERLRADAARVAHSVREMKDPIVAKIEEILSHGLGAEYALLNQAQKDAFRQEGEELALWLRDAVTQGKVQPHKLLQRMEHWLLMIEAKDRFEPWLLKEAYKRVRQVLRGVMYEERGH